MFFEVRSQPSDVCEARNIVKCHPRTPNCSSWLHHLVPTDVHIRSPCSPGTFLISGIALLYINSYLRVVARWQYENGCCVVRRCSWCDRWHVAWSEFVLIELLSFRFSKISSSIVLFFCRVTQISIPLCSSKQSSTHYRKRFAQSHFTCCWTVLSSSIRSLEQSTLRTKSGKRLLII